MRTRGIFGHSEVETVWESRIIERVENLDDGLYKICKVESL